MVDRGVVTGGPRSTVATVGSRDRLEGVEVLPDAADRDALGQLGDGVVVPGVAAGGSPGGQRGDHAAGEREDAGGADHREA